MSRLEILETCLYATDLESATDFYERVLGLRVTSRVEGRHVFFRCGGRMLLVFHPARTAESTDVPAHGARGPGHVAFAVAPGELAEWRTRLRERGVEIEREVEWPRGGSSLYFRDPAGNSIELAGPEIWGIPERETFGAAERG